MRNKFRYYKEVFSGDVVRICFIQVVENKIFFQEGWCLDDSLIGIPFDIDEMKEIRLEEFRELLKEYDLGKKVESTSCLQI